MAEVEREAIERDHPLVQEVLAETPEEDREKLMTICRNSIPAQMVFREGVVFVTTVFNMGVDLHNFEDDRIHIDYSEDSKRFTLISGRTIIWGKLDNDGYIDLLAFFFLIGSDLPASIARLERLECLTLHKCPSFPVELSNVPTLKKLSLLNFSPDLLSNIPVEMKLSNLKSLYIQNKPLDSSEPSSSLPSSFTTWVTGQLPSLEKLSFHDMEHKGILEALRIPEMCFQDTLKKLTIGSCNVDDKSFETLFLSVCPLFPGLITLSLPKNNIEGVQSIVERVQKDSTFSPSKLLGKLDLTGNPIMKKMKEDTAQTATMLSFLEICNTVYNLGGDKKADYGSDIDYALRKNISGRRIIVNGHNNGGDNDDGGNNSRSIVPLSLWPTILVQAYEKSEAVYDTPNDSEEIITNNATGIYYLLREGPVLIGRPDLLCCLSGGGDIDRCKNTSDGDSGNDNVDGGANTSNPVSSLKRKRKRKANGL